MKFICTQPKLYQSLAITEKIIGRNLTLPILASTLITADKKQGILKLCSTDLEMGVEVETTAKIHEDGSAAIPSKLLSGFIRDLPSENIELEEKNKKINLHCSGYKSVIKSESADDFPIIPNPASDRYITTSGKDFVFGISSVINSVSNLEIKPEISGVLMYVREDNIYFVATDSFRLSERVMKLAAPSSFMCKIIIPKKCCDGILKIFQNVEGDLKIQVSDSQIIVKNETKDVLMPKIRFVGRLIDGDYPDYEQIIPKSFSKTAEISKTDFVQRIKTASLFSNKINEITCTFNTKKQQIEITSANQEYGECLTVVPCSIKGEDERITFNFHYLLDGVQYINSPKLLFKVNNATTPALIEAAEDEGFKYLVMPIKSI